MEWAPGCIFLLFSRKKGGGRGRRDGGFRLPGGGRSAPPKSRRFCGSAVRHRTAGRARFDGGTMFPRKPLLFGRGTLAGRERSSSAAKPLTSGSPQDNPSAHCVGTSLYTREALRGRFPPCELPFMRCFRKPRARTARPYKGAGRLTGDTYHALGRVPGRISASGRQKSFRAPAIFLWYRQAAPSLSKKEMVGPTVLPPGGRSLSSCGPRPQILRPRPRRICCARSKSCKTPDFVGKNGGKISGEGSGMGAEFALFRRILSHGVDNLFRKRMLLP